ncbi:MAG: DUF4097 domain-containing protein [Clostridiales bacterium]|jgi:hypothetical protein|nr:DUF4097 domain-containing protein [Clostridiales bacterium]
MSNDNISSPFEFEEPPKKRKGFALPLIIGVLIGFGLFVAFQSFSGGGGGPITDSHLSDHSFAAGNIRRITSDLGVTNINVRNHDGNDIRVYFNAPAMGNYLRPRWELSGGTLNIYRERQNVSAVFGISRAGSVNIYLPANFGQGLDALELRTSTGRINVNVAGFVANSLNLRATTGTIDISGEIEAGSVEIQASTGRVTIGGVSASMLSATTTTGNIVLANAEAAGAISLRASTGRVNATQIGTDAGLEIRTTTGNIVLEDIDSLSLAVQASTGRINADNLSIYGNASLTASTGSITINNADIEGLLETRTSTGNITFINVEAGSYTTNSNTGRIRIN